MVSGKALINVKRDVNEDIFDNDWEIVEESEGLDVTYTVDGSTCKLEFRTVHNNSIEEGIGIDIQDATIPVKARCLTLVERAKNDHVGLILHVEDNRTCYVKLEKSNYESRIPGGDTAVRTKLFLYEDGNKRGLLVREESIKKGDEYPFKVIITHYYAARRLSVSSTNRFDIGVSVAINIQVSNGDLGYTLDGPHEHPSFALFDMFDQVLKTKTWKPTFCPHCAGGFQPPQQQLSTSKSKDDTGNPPAPALPPPPPQFHVHHSARIQRRQHSTSKSKDDTNSPPAQPQFFGRWSALVSNNGSVRGNGNGNLIVHGNLTVSLPRV